MLVPIVAMMLLVAAPTVLATPQIQTWKNAQGISIFLVENHALPIIDIQVAFAAGSVFDPPGKSGLAELTNDLLELGAGQWDEKQISEQLADVGANMVTYQDNDRAFVQTRSLSSAAALDKTTTLLAAMLSAPRFEADIFAREQARQITGLKDALTRPDVLASRAFWQQIYGSHPYGQLSSEQSLQSLNRQDLLDFFARYYVRENAIFTLVGDVDRAAAERIVGQLTAQMRSGSAASFPEVQPPASVAKTVHIPHPAVQAHIYMGQLGFARGSPDFFPLSVGNYTLGGGGFSSRLMQEVREKRGYAYSVSSTFQPLHYAGPFFVSLQTKTSQVKDALAVSTDTINKFIKDGPSAADVEAAKSYLSGSFPLNLDSNAKLMSIVSVIAFYHLPLDWLDRYQQEVRATTAEQIKSRFAAYINPNQFITIIVGGSAP